MSSLIECYGTSASLDAAALQSKYSHCSDQMLEVL